MNRKFSTKLPSLVLLIVMLLNPIIGLAGSFVLENTQQLPLEASSNMLERCHDNLGNGSKSGEEKSVQNHAECCDGLCQCAQGSCYSPVATLGKSESSLYTPSIYLQSGLAEYSNPALSSQTPPPIS